MHETSNAKRIATGALALTLATATLPASALADTAPADNDRPSAANVAQAPQDQADQESTSLENASLESAPEGSGADAETADRPAATLVESDADAADKALPAAVVGDVDAADEAQPTAAAAQEDAGALGDNAVAADAAETAPAFTAQDAANFYGSVHYAVHRSDGKTDSGDMRIGSVDNIESFSAPAQVDGVWVASATLKSSITAEDLGISDLLGDKLVLNAEKSSLTVTYTYHESGSYWDASSSQALLIFDAVEEQAAPEAPTDAQVEAVDGIVTVKGVDELTGRPAPGAEDYVTRAKPRTYRVGAVEQREDGTYAVSVDFDLNDYAMAAAATDSWKAAFDGPTYLRERDAAATLSWDGSAWSLEKGATFTMQGELRQQSAPSTDFANIDGANAVQMVDSSSNEVVATLPLVALSYTLGEPEQDPAGGWTVEATIIPSQAQNYIKPLNDAITDDRVYLNDTSKTPTSLTLHNSGETGAKWTVTSPAQSYVKLLSEQPDAPTYATIAGEPRVEFVVTDESGKQTVVGSVALQDGTFKTREPQIEVGSSGIWHSTGVLDDGSFQAYVDALSDQLGAKYELDPDGFTNELFDLTYDAAAGTWSQTGAPRIAVKEAAAEQSAVHLFYGFSDDDHPTSDGEVVVFAQVGDKLSSVYGWQEEPVREGYTFAGWYADKGLTQRVDGDTVIDKGWYGVYAKWEQAAVTETFTVTFDSAGGTAVEAQDVEQDAVAKQPADPTREGYTFAGWTLDGTAYDFSAPVTGDLTLVATWVPNEAAAETPQKPVGGNGGQMQGSGASQQPTAAQPTASKPAAAPAKTAALAQTGDATTGIAAAGIAAAVASAFAAIASVLRRRSER